MLVAMALSASGSETPSGEGDDDNDVEAPPISLDPRLRRALLRVLTKLEEEDRRRGRDERQQVADDMRNVVDEDQFIRYFQERGLEKELIDSFEKERPKEDPTSNSQEILSFSADEMSAPEKPFTFASYPEEEEEPRVTPDTVQESKDEAKYPATNPTPALDNAIYFQIPEPVHIPDLDDVEERSPSANQETRSVQGPTLVAPAENEYRQDERDEAEQNEDKEGQEASKDEQKVSFVKTDEQEKNEVRESDGDEEKTEVEISASNSTEVEGNSTVKVEFLTAPLLAAFTVQQDQQGLPRRVIPLNYRASGEPIPLPDNEHALQEQSYQKLKQAQQEILFQTQRKELERQRQFQQQYNFQQSQLLQQNQQFQQNQLDHQIQQFNDPQRHLGPKNVYFQKSVDFQFQPFAHQQTQNLPILQSPSNAFELTNSFQASEFGRANLQEPSNLGGNFGPSTTRPVSSFQTQSFAASFPQGGFQPVELNRVNRHEPSGHVGNFGPLSSFAQQQPRHSSSQHNFLGSSFRHRFAPQAPVAPSLDNQLQSLFSITGIAGGAPGAQEDLNIVSKVLALGHGERQLLQNQRNRQFQNQQQSQNQQYLNLQQPQNEQFLDSQFNNQQFQASTRHEQVVEAPARVIQPPIL